MKLKKKIKNIFVKILVFLYYRYMEFYRFRNV